MSDDITNDPELEHAMAVLRAASVEPDKDRRERVYQAAQGTGSILYLWPLAAGVAACFIIGLGVLIFVAIGGGTHQPQVAQTNTERPTNTEPAKTNAPANSGGQNTGSAQGGGLKERPEWITKQVTELSGRATGLGGVEAGGSPPLGGGSNENGGSTGGSSGGSRDIGGDEDPLESLAREVDFLLFRVTSSNQYKLDGATIIPTSETGAGFDIARVEYVRGDERLLILQAADSEDSRHALAAEGLEGAVLGVIRDGTVLLVISNTLSKDELRQLELEPVE